MPPANGARRSRGVLSAWLGVVVACGALVGAAQDVTPSNATPPSAASPTAWELFFAEFRDAARRQDFPALCALTHLPFVDHYGDSFRSNRGATSRTRAECEARISRVFTADVPAVLDAATPRRSGEFYVVPAGSAGTLLFGRRGGRWGLLDRPVGNRHRRP